MRTPQNLDFIFHKLKGNLNKIKKKATKIITVLPDNSLTPIPVKEHDEVRGVAAIFNKKQYQNAERTAVFIRRMEYSNGMNKNYKIKKNSKDIYLDKITYLQEWWKIMYKIIKLQKYIRGYLLRRNLMKDLEHQEKLYQFLTNSENIYVLHLYRKFFNKLKRKSKQIYVKGKKILDAIDNRKNLKKIKKILQKWKKRIKMAKAKSFYEKKIKRKLFNNLRKNLYLSKFFILLNNILGKKNSTDTKLNQLEPNQIEPELIKKYKNKFFNRLRPSTEGGKDNLYKLLGLLIKKREKYNLLKKAFIDWKGNKPIKEIRIVIKRKSDKKNNNHNKSDDNYNEDKKSDEDKNNKDINHEELEIIDNLNNINKLGGMNQMEKNNKIDKNNKLDKINNVDKNNKVDKIDRENQTGNEEYLISQQNTNQFTIYSGNIPKNIQFDNIESQIINSFSIKDNKNQKEENSLARNEKLNDIFQMRSEFDAKKLKKFFKKWRKRIKNQNYTKKRISRRKKISTYNNHKKYEKKNVKSLFNILNEKINGNIKKYFDIWRQKSKTKKKVIDLGNRYNSKTNDSTKNKLKYRTKTFDINKRRTYIPPNDIPINENLSEEDSYDVNKIGYNDNGKVGNNKGRKKNASYSKMPRSSSGKKNGSYISKIKPFIYSNDNFNISEVDIPKSPNPKIFKKGEKIVKSSEDKIKTTKEDKNDSDDNSVNISISNGINLKEAKIENLKPMTYTSQSFFLDKNARGEGNFISYHINNEEKNPMKMRGDFSKLIQKNIEILNQKNARIQVTNATFELEQEEKSNKEINDKLKKNTLKSILLNCDKDIYKSQAPFESEKNKWISMSIPLKDDSAKWEFLNGLKGERYKDNTNSFELIQKSKIYKKNRKSYKNRSLNTIYENPNMLNEEYKLREMNYKRFYGSPTNTYSKNYGYKTMTLNTIKRICKESYKTNVDNYYSKNSS